MQQVMSVPIDSSCWLVSTATYGKAAGTLKAGIVTVLMDGSDWPIGVPIACYRVNMDDVVGGMRLLQAAASRNIVTLLWVPDSWRPDRRISDLEDFRRARRAPTCGRTDPNLHSTLGPSSSDDQASFSDAVAVQPNDGGCTLMA